MASTINFENYVKRFRESMRGIQRILYIGTSIDMTKNPALAGLPWKCIYTSSTSESLAETLSQANERQIRLIRTIEDYDKATTKLDQHNPLLIYINGAEPQDAELEDLDAEFDRQENQKALRNTLGLMLKSELMIELIIVGYDPNNEREISPEDLYRNARALSDNRLYFFGLSEEAEKDKHITSLVDKGIATVFSQDLGIALEQSANRIRREEERFSAEEPEESSLRETVYINGSPVLLNKRLCYDFEKYGRILSIAEMYTGTITRAMQVDYFYQFLKRSSNAPQWYGYAKRNGFAVKRDFEEELYRAVIDGIESNSNTPIILAGQSSSGKSVALGSLAFRLFQERKYPVLFINNPEIVFSAGSQAAIALDNLLLEIREKGGYALVILDWSLYSLRNNAVRSISDRYYNRSQKALFVASAMIAPKDNRYRIVQAPIELSDSEKKSFKELVIDKGHLPRNRVERWMEHYGEESGLLSLMYTLIYELHPQLESGIRQEISKGIEDTKEIINDMEDPIPIKRGMNAITAQLLEMFPEYAPKETEKESGTRIKEVISNSLQLFSESVAVASLFKLRMPLTMATHILQIPECENRKAYRDVVLNAPWLVYAMDDDKYAPGEYYVEFRAPIDARVFLTSLNMTKPRMMEIVADIIRTVKKEKDTFYTTEIRFLERLIRMIGPNSDDPAVKENWYTTYGKGCPSVIAALSELRENGIVEPQLVAQEITYIREYYGNEQQADLSLRIDWLQKAIRIARDILSMVERPNIETSHWVPGLIDSITVESIFAELQLERWHKQAEDYGISYDNTSAPILYSYSTRCQKLKEVINAQPENSYAYTALLSCFLAQYEDVIYSAAIDADTFRNMSDVLEIVDMTAASIPAVELNEFYQARKADFLRVFDEACGSGRTDKYFNELLEMGSAVGVYIKARTIIRAANITFNEPLNRSAEKSCKAALDLLENEEYESVVKTNAACQSMRLQLTWLYFNKFPLFRHERQTTKLTDSQWTQLYEICVSFEENIIKKQPECTYRATVYYLLALASAQLRDYEEAVNIWRKVREDDFYDTGRQNTWHVLCKPDGSPMQFTGTFNRGAISEQSIYIKEMQRKVFYRSLQSINKSDTSGEASNLCIGTSFRGFRAFAENREKVRE